MKRTHLRRLGPIFPAALLLVGFSILDGQSPASNGAGALVQKIQEELSGPFPPPEGEVDPNVAHGELIRGSVRDSKIFPGTENDFQVYVPSQYNPSKPACFLAKLDGLGAYEATVLDNLIAKNEIPVMIGIGIAPGTVWKPSGGTAQRQAARFNRSYEFDSVNYRFPDYVLNELLPAIEKLRTRDGRAIQLSRDGNDHAVTGNSTGGIGSFTLAWRRPDQFTRVYSVIGTFVSMRGGHEYPALIRKTDPKPIRIFLEDGSTDAWNPLFGSWYAANLEMESALSFAGYEVAHAWGEHGHNGRPGQVIFPDVMRWLWRDYPTRVRPGTSSNSTLKEITLPDEGWKEIPQSFQSAAGLAAGSNGDVYLSDEPQAAIYRIGSDDKAVAFLEHGPRVIAEAFGPNGTLYGVVPSQKRVVAFSPQATSRTIADGIAGHAIVVRHDGTLFVSEPGAHDDMPSRIWRIASGGEKKIVDQGLLSASGVAFSPDGALFFAAENATKWIYSYIVQPDGSFADKQSFYWLHMTDVPNNSGAEDVALDTLGNLYAATRMGVQVCDQNGRVRAILPLAAPSGPVRSLCFGGKQFNVLYATDGRHVFKRALKVRGFSQWADPVAYKSQGAG